MKRWKEYSLAIGWYGGWRDGAMGEEEEKKEVGKEKMKGKRREDVEC